ncbi:MAG: GGDEF domain-containing phosphodiesterase, partial [Bacillota bacterium]
DELLKYADMAMYQAKAAGKNGCQFYTARMHALFQRKTSIEEALRTALERREFTLYYQPLLTTDGGTLRGFEALIRWNCNSMGFVPPLEFIAVAEEIGIINDIGRWVLHTACAKLAALTGKTGKALIMAVNISAHQLKDVNFIKDVADALAAYDLQPAQLELEITESAVIDSMEETVAALQKLRSLGVKVTLDDFGTGYSSLSYLHQLPIDTIKIDKSFFRDIVANQRAQDMLAGIVYLARKLGLNVVTEGIENKEQVAYIRGIDCDFAQGYYYKKPMPADETEEFCARWSEAPLSGEVTS